MKNKEENLKKVHLLREKTGLSLLYCKYALSSNDWDTDKAIKYLINKNNTIRFTI